MGTNSESPLPLLLQLTLLLPACVPGSPPPPEPSPCGTPCPEGELCEQLADDTFVCLEICQRTAECEDDGLFCNGRPTCEASGSQPEGDVCVPGAPPCPEGLRCDEDAEACEECRDDGDCARDETFCSGPLTCDDGRCRGHDPPCGEGELCDEAAGACVQCIEDFDCEGDGLFCDGAFACVDGFCEAGPPPCAANEVCDEDTWTCMPAGDVSVAIEGGDRDVDGCAPFSFGALVTGLAAPEYAWEVSGAEASIVGPADGERVEVFAAEEGEVRITLTATGVDRHGAARSMDTATRVDARISIRIRDDDWAGADWGDLPAPPPRVVPDPPPEVRVEQDATPEAGNPSPCRRVEARFSTSLAERRPVDLLFHHVAQPYDPSNGRVNRVMLTTSLSLRSPTHPEDVALMLSGLLVQDGVVFLGLPHASAGYHAPLDRWVDFTAELNAGSVASLEGAVPDFAEGAAPMTFGLRLQVGTDEPEADEVEVEIRLDGFEAVVDRECP